MWWQPYKDRLRFLMDRAKRLGSPSLSFIVSGIGLCYFLAFVSLIPQLPGLIGDQGLLPVTALNAAYEQHYGATAIWEMKSLTWWISSSSGLQILAGVGAVSSILVVLGYFRMLSLLVAWGIYGSLFVAGQSFLSFQWDTLLLEAGIAGACLAAAIPEKNKAVSGPALLLVRLLAAKVMISAGLAKLLSGDTWWRDWTALTVHFETQPLPTVVGWFFHQMPFSILLFGMLWLWVAELIAPLLAFIPGRIRVYSTLCMLLFQVMIALAGNYGFFNLLTAVLLLSFWVQLPDPSGASEYVENSASRRLKKTIPFLLSVTLLLGLGNRFVFQNSALGTLDARLSAWRLQFQYGLFATMTYPRWEISLEVSADKERWHEILFYYKPYVDSRLPWVTPHMPRLDWLMWFAALHPEPQVLPWLQRLADGILKKEPSVLALLPPVPEGDFRYIRLQRRQYRFSDEAEYHKKAVFWIEESSFSPMP